MGRFLLAIFLLASAGCTQSICRDLEIFSIDMGKLDGAVIMKIYGCGFGQRSCDSAVHLSGELALLRRWGDRQIEVALSRQTGLGHKYLVITREGFPHPPREVWITETSGDVGPTGYEHCRIPRDGGPAEDGGVLPDGGPAEDGGPLPDGGPCGTLPLGQLCNSGSQCASCLCVDSTCCKERCDGLCESCNRPGTEGRCTVLRSGEDAPHCTAPQRCNPGGICVGAIATSPPGSHYFKSSLLWTGSLYGVTWHDDREGNLELYFSQLYADGHERGAATRITRNRANSWDPSLAWTGSEYGVAWWNERYSSSDGEVYFARIDAQGLKLGYEVILTNGWNVREPSLAWSGSEFGLAWSDMRGGNYELYFARMGMDGQKLGQDVRITHDADTSHSPSLVWTGSAYAMAWGDWRDGLNPEVYFILLDPAGGRLGPERRITWHDELALHPSLVWTGSGFGLSWDDSRHGNYEIYFTRLGPDGVPLGSETRISRGEGVSQYPSLVWTGREYGMAWWDQRDGENEIFFRRIGANGVTLGAERRLSFASGISLYPSLAWSGSDYAVTWWDSRDGNFEIYLGRFRPR